MKKKSILTKIETISNVLDKIKTLLIPYHYETDYDDRELSNYPKKLFLAIHDDNSETIYNNIQAIDDDPINRSNAMRRIVEYKQTGILLEWINKKWVKVKKFTYSIYDDD